MRDKELLRLISEFVCLKDNNLRETIYYYINKNIDNIDKEDLKKASLVFLKIDTFDYINCNYYEDFIENIDNYDYINDEENYM